jgi:hypothetical protein
VRLHLNKDYNGTQTFLPFVYKVTIHDNNDKHPDAQAEQSFILATDAEQSEIGNDVIKNVSTKKMGMTSATTPTQIVQYLKANNNTLTGDQVLSDDFIKNNLNANQLAALLFLETLEIQKNWLVNLNDKYSFIPGRSEILPD